MEQTNINCLICQKYIPRVIHKMSEQKMQTNVVICKNCGLVYLNMRMNKEKYELYYKDGYHAEYERYFISDAEMKKWWDWQGNYILKNIKGKLKDKADILEIGCAGGGILYPFKQNGYNVTGTELSEKWVDFGKTHYGIDIHKKDMAGLLEEKQKYDLIIFSHFLEHVPDPIQMLLQARRILKPKGIIYAETPDIRGIDPVTGPNSFFCRAHLHYFSRRTLKYVIQSAGFDPFFENIGGGAVRYLASPDNKTNAAVQKPGKSEYIMTCLYLELYKLQYSLHLGQFLKKIKRAAIFLKKFLSRIPLPFR